MTLTTAADPMAPQRADAVREAVDRIRALLPVEAPDAAALAAAETVLRALAARSELWSAAAFPIAAGRLWQAYLLHEDADGGCAAYAVPMHPGHAQPPHDHTTWALIAGVRGQERNLRYRRPDGARSAPLQLLSQRIVDAASSLSLGPADLHAIEVLGPHDAFHLHVYGRGLDHLPQRRIFDLHTGASRPFPAIPSLS